MADCVKFFNRGEGDLAVQKAIAISTPDTPDKKAKFSAFLRSSASKFHASAAKSVCYIIATAYVWRDLEVQQLSFQAQQLSF